VTGVEQVFPRAGGSGGAYPAAGPTSSGGAKVKLGKRELMIGGAVAVAGLALVARSRGGGETSDGGDSASADRFEIDTRDTDLYNDLQPELEAIQDAIRDTPKPATPTQIRDAIKPLLPKPSPKPAPKKKKPRPPKGKHSPKKKPPKKKPRR
jgi:hypothetical protein